MKRERVFVVDCHLSREICGFSCTGFEGKKIWQELEQTVKKIDCETCRDHATDLVSFLHDLVNAGLGKPLFNEKNFNKIYKQIQCVHDKMTGEPA